MPNLDIGQALASDMTNKIDNWQVNPIVTDGATGQKETVWSNNKWSVYWGYFNSVPDLHAALLMKAIWNVGKGYQCDSATQVILDSIKGWGKDTFDDILFNMELIRRIAGDSYAEIIRDNEGNLLNLKPLDPSSIRIVVDKKGIILRYEQFNKLSPSDPVIKFEPDEIFHLSNKRLADQIHGISDIDALESVIKADMENFTDMQKIMHRQRGMIMFKLGTDDPVRIAEFVDKMDKATNKGENIYIPDDQNTVSFEAVPINVSAVIMQWRDDLRNKFYRALGLPLIIFGSAGSTESGGKIEYLAHEQVFEHDQHFLEQQLWNQLKINIDLNPPTSLLDNLQTDQGKDGANQQMGMQQSDMIAGRGR